jgi:hypothetical protein
MHGKAEELGDAVSKWRNESDENADHNNDAGDLDLNDLGQVSGNSFVQNRPHLLISVVIAANVDAVVAAGVVVALPNVAAPRHSA